jgi:hypothetical protein
MDKRLCCCIGNEHCRYHIALTHKLAALVLCYVLTLSKPVKVIYLVNVTMPKCMPDKSQLFTKL